MSATRRPRRQRNAQALTLRESKWRGRDSNPRGPRGAYQLSRLARSTALAPLRDEAWRLELEARGAGVIAARSRPKPSRSAAPGQAGVAHDLWKGEAAVWTGRIKPSITYLRGKRISSSRTNSR